MKNDLWVGVGFGAFGLKDPMRSVSVASGGRRQLNRLRLKEIGWMVDVAGFCTISVGGHCGWWCVGAVRCQKSLVVGGGRTLRKRGKMKP